MDHLQAVHTSARVEERGWAYHGPAVADADRGGPLPRRAIVAREERVDVSVPRQAGNVGRDVRFPRERPPPVAPGKARHAFGHPGWNVDARNPNGGDLEVRRGPRLTHVCPPSGDST